MAPKSVLVSVLFKGLVPTLGPLNQNLLGWADHGLFKAPKVRLMRREVSGR